MFSPYGLIAVQSFMSKLLSFLFFMQMLSNYCTVESGYLAHAPDESTTATCALDNGTRGLTSSIILTRPHL